MNFLVEMKRIIINYYISYIFHSKFRIFLIYSLIVNIFDFFKLNLFVCILLHFVSDYIGKINLKNIHRLLIINNAKNGRKEKDYRINKFLQQQAKKSANEDENIRVCMYIKNWSKITLKT